MGKPKTLSIVVVAIVIALVLGAGVYFWTRTPAPEQTPVVAHQEATPTPGPSPEPEIHYPISKEKETDAKPLPALDQSDMTFDQELAALFGKDRFEKLFNVHDFIRHVVVTVDNLGEKKLPSVFSPMQPLEGSFTAKHEGDNRTLSSENFARYTPFIELVEQMDMAKVVKIYSHYYPLFQAAYKDLGMTGYFNDRLVSSIDDLLKTPTPTSPVQLLGEDPYYTFADPKLEALGAGQKILLRVGPENEAKLKAKLKQLRTQLLN